MMNPSRYTSPGSGWSTASRSGRAASPYSATAIGRAAPPSRSRSRTSSPRSSSPRSIDVALRELSDSSVIAVLGTDPRDTAVA